MRPLLLLQPPPQPAIIAVDFITGHPRERNVGRDGTLDHELGQLRLGQERPLRRHADPFAALAIAGPVLGQVQFPVDQRMALAAAIAQEPPDLTVLDASRRARVLTSDANRLGSFLQEARLVYDQNTIRSTQMFDHVTATQGPGLVLAPQRVGQYSLGAPGPGIADLFGQLPTILAFGRTQQGFQIKTRLLPRLRPHEELAQPVLHLLQFISPLVQSDWLHHHAHVDLYPQMPQPTAFCAALAMIHGVLTENRKWKTATVVLCGGTRPRQRLDRRDPVDAA